jgi:hypothetical protein
MTRTLFVIVLATALASCSLFSKPSSNWTPASGDSDQTATDLSACRQQADAVIRRDADIDSDIAAARSDPADPDSSLLLPDVEAYDREQRHRRIVNDCMRQRGYVLPETDSPF